MTGRSASDAPLRRNPTALFRRIIDGVLVLPAGATTPLQVGAPGDLIWVLLADRVTPAELVASLSDFYQVPETDIRGDVERVIETFIEAGAILVDDATG